MNFYQTDPGVIFLLVLLEIWAQTETFLHWCPIYQTYHHLGLTLALILKCCPVPKYTHKPGYDEKIVVKNDKKNASEISHLFFLISTPLFDDLLCKSGVWDPHKEDKNVGCVVTDIVSLKYFQTLKK